MENKRDHKARRSKFDKSKHRAKGNVFLIGLVLNALCLDEFQMLFVLASNVSYLLSHGLEDNYGLVSLIRC